MSKFDQLFYEFIPQETNFSDICVSPQAYFRGDRDMPGANMNVGFQVLKVPLLLEKEPHFHREEEYLVFLGAKLPDVFSSFDAEIELFLGPTLDAMEKIVITSATIVRIPKGYWHCPLDFKRISKPLLFQAALLNGNFGSVRLRKNKDGRNTYLYLGDEVNTCVLDPEKPCTYCGKCSDSDESVMTAPAAPFWTVKPGPLSDLIKPLVCELPIERPVWSDTPQAYFRGDTYMPGANYHVGFQVVEKDLDMEYPHFHQGADEYIFFMGADPMNIFDFDAEIDISIGDDPDHMEVFKITKPTVVRLPPTVWHCPILFRNMKKPVLFQAAFLAGCWGTIVRQQDEKGQTLYVYGGDNVRFCKLNPGVRCTLCGKCFEGKATRED